MRKIRIQSPLDLLPLPTKQQLTAWLTTAGPDGHGMTYAEAKAKLLAEYGVHATEGALCRFFQRTHRGPQTIEVAVTPENKTITLTINIRVQPARETVE